MQFDNTYVRELVGFYQTQMPTVKAKGALVFSNHSLAESFALNWNLAQEQWRDWLSGAQIPQGAEPIAQVYAGHQFGQFSPQLGDGRAVILGEIHDRHAHRFDIALKGSGRTAFSRSGDGKAALAPMLREALISEAMHALGVATTRTLAVVQTSEIVPRQKQHPGAVLTRIAASHIRIGTFEFFASRQETDKVARLIDYTIKRHHPQLIERENHALALLQETGKALAELIAHWMSIGFIHGVMNTDNMSMAGETIDYGPCAFMDSYNPKTVFSSIDHNGRYAYGNQPAIGQWNLARLAEALLPHIHSNQDQAVEQATQVLNRYSELYQQARTTRMLAKLGLEQTTNNAGELLEDWLVLLHQQNIDFTNAFTALADAADSNTNPLLELSTNSSAMGDWLSRWQAASKHIAKGQQGTAMRGTNPTIIARNHLVEKALTVAEEGDMQPFNQLYTALQTPFDTQHKNSQFAQPADSVFTNNFRTYCGT